MKRYMRTVNAAEATSAEDRIEDTIKQLQDDFDYAVDGVYQLVGRGQLDDATSVLNQLKEAVSQAIESVSGSIVE